MGRLLVLVLVLMAGQYRGIFKRFIYSRLHARRTMVRTSSLLDPGHTGRRHGQERPIYLRRLPSPGRHGLSAPTTRPSVTPLPPSRPIWKLPLHAQNPSNHTTPAPRCPSAALLAAVPCRRLMCGEGRRSPYRVAPAILAAHPANRGGFVRKGQWGPCKWSSSRRSLPPSDAHR